MPLVEWNGDEIRNAIIEECARAAEKAWPRMHTGASENADVYRGQDHAVPGQNRAAERMIKRGFLTKPEQGFSPPAPDWLVVVITNKNLACLQAAAAPLPTGQHESGEL